MWQIPRIPIEEILVYLRKSRTDDATMTVEETLAKHEQMLNDWVERNLPGQGQIPEENRFREIVSGETIDSRPEIQKLLRKIESPQYKAVLIKDPQRLSRGDLEDIGRLVKLLRYSNTFVFTLDYVYDLRDARDRDDFERELKRGNEHLEYQKRIMNNGRILSVQNGNFIAPTPPYGYKKVQYKEGKSKYYTLEPIPEQAEGVKLIFKLYLDGYGKRKIANTLDALGVPTQTGKPWSPSSIEDILANEHYLGKVIWNKRPTERTIENGNVKVSRPAAAKYMVSQGKHPAIIDQETWDAVQAKRGTMPREKTDVSLKNPLSGLIFCGKCGTSLNRRTFAKDGMQIARDRIGCRNQHKCGTASSALEDILADVANMLEITIENFRIELNSEADTRIEKHSEMIAKLERRLEELRELEIKQWNEKILGLMPIYVFERLNEKTLADITKTKSELEEAQKNMPRPADKERAIRDFQAALNAMRDPNSTAKETNYLLKKCINRIDYYRKPEDNWRKIYDGQEPPFRLEYHTKV